MRYYWISNIPQAEGDIISPGNWGKLVKNTPGHRWMHMEQQFETIRIMINHELPSRLDCAFVFDDLETTRLLQSKRGDSFAYEVELLDNDKPLHRADMALVHPELEQYNAHVGNPKKYWSAKPSEVLNWPEILTMSRLKIIKIL